MPLWKELLVGTCVFFWMLMPMSQAYGPNVIDDTGIVLWDLPVIVDRETDLTKECPGGGTADLSSFVGDAIAVWEGAPETNLSTTLQSLGSAVDHSNVCDFFFDPGACPLGVGNPNGPSQSGGSSPVVFDEDGQITELFFGTGSKLTTLGFAGIISFDSATLKAVKGEGVINATCMDGCADADCTTTFETNDILSFVAHELGHFFGMNHTQVNNAETDESARATMNAIFNPSSAANIATLERDDQVGMANLYPATSGSTLDDFCTVTGTILDENGDEFQCANVIVRNTDSSSRLTDVMSFVSGGDKPGATTASGRGVFTVKGLAAGSTYSVEVRPIDTSGVLSAASSGIIPCNGGSNPSAPSFDVQTLSDTVTCAASSPSVSALAATAGSALTLSDITLSGTSGNVSSGGSTSSGTSSGSGTSTSSSSGGCSLIR